MVSKLSPRTGRLAAEIGEQLRAARLAAEVSQEALAEKIGMTRGNYARIEQGRTNVTIDTLLRIADGLGVELVVSVGARRGRARGR
ncbi:MAG: helix-turn-helix transcriptional regulator [Labilithrix sp.]|nr:helix-turn-helix transcriptional regulator [Labilithrix sp.]